MFLREHSRNLEVLACYRAIICSDEIHVRERTAWSCPRIEDTRLPDAEGVFVWHACSAEEGAQKQPREP